MNKTISFAMMFLVVLSTVAILAPQVKAKTDLVSLPGGCKNIDPSNLDLDESRLLIDVDVAGSGQTAFVNPGETVSGSLTYQIYSGAGNPSEINQGLFIMSWTPNWPAPSGYYIPIWNGISGVYPGVTRTEPFSLIAPSNPGVYYLYWCGGAEYSMSDAVVRYNQPLTLPAHAKIVVSGESTCPWHSTTSLPTPLYETGGVTHDNKIYVVGGSTGSPSSTVYYATINTDGHVNPDSWLSTTPLPNGRSNPAVVVYEDWIYVLGGSAPRPPHWIERDTVWFAPINPEGTVGSWTETTRMPYRSPEVAVQWNGRIYILAGWDGYSQHNDVHSAEINPDGTLGSWIRTTSLPEVRAHGHQAVVYDGVIYFIGGTTGRTGPPHIHREVYYATIQPSGGVGVWTETSLLPVGLEAHAAVVHENDILVMGGVSQSVFPEQVRSDKAYKAHINPDGSLDSWEEWCRLPEPLVHPSSVVLNNRLYVIGGSREDGSLTDTVCFTGLVPSLHPALKLGVESLQALKVGVLDGSHIVDEQTLGTAVAALKAGVNFLSAPLPDKDLWVKIGEKVVKKGVKWLMEKIKDVEVDTLYSYYTEGEPSFEDTMGEWEEYLESLNAVFLTNEERYDPNANFIKDMQTFHQYCSDTGQAYPQILNEIVDAHEWEELQRDILFFAGSIAIVVVTHGAALPLLVEVGLGVTYSGIEGIVDIRDEADFYQTLSDASWLQEIGALNYATDIAMGLQYVAEKLDSNDLSFPEISLSPIPGGGAWITNEYDKPIKIEITHSVTLNCYEEQTIEPAQRHYEASYGEFTIEPGSFTLYIQPPDEEPPDVKRWRDHLESFGHSISEWSHLRIRYGEEGLHAMKFVPLPIEGETFSVLVESPINLLVTDQTGLRVGFDPNTQNTVNEITGAKYTGPGFEPQLVTIPSPLLGTYTITLFGTDTGPYIATFATQYADGTAVISQTYTGETVEGAVYVYSVSITDEVMTASPDPVAELEHLKEFIDGLPDSSFDKPKLASQRKNVLFNKIDEVILKVEAGNYTDAINKLLHDIRPKMDGDSTPKDWIIDQAMELRVIIDHIISDIETIQQT